MITIKEDILQIELPQGKTQSELVINLKDKLKTHQSEFYGRDIKINGRCTTAIRNHIQMITMM